MRKICYGESFVTNDLVLFSAFYVCLIIIIIIIRIIIIIIRDTTGDTREATYLLQRMSVALQRGNVVTTE